MHSGARLRSVAEIVGKTLVLLSLVIPTRERAHTLRYALEASLNSPETDYEIVVSDNKSDDETAEVVAGFDDPRIKYVCTPRRLSMRQNFEFGLSHTSGQYVMFIGDDDAFLAEHWPKLRYLLQSHQPEALSWHAPRFFWAGAGPSHLSGRFEIYRDHFVAPPHTIDCVEVRKSLLSGRQSSRLPTIYHGIFRRSLIRKMAECGGVFGGAIPDIYASYLSCFVMDEFWAVDFPFSVSGASNNSTGMSVMSRHLSREDSPANLFAKESDSDPCQDVISGRFHSSMNSISFVTLETVKARLRESPFSGVLEPTNYRHWLERCVADMWTLPTESREASLSEFRTYANSVGEGETFSQIEQEIKKAKSGAGAVFSDPAVSSKRRPLMSNFIRGSRIGFGWRGADNCTVADATAEIAAVLPEGLWFDQRRSNRALWRTMQKRALLRLVRKSFGAIT
jgi:glycosyltransferase involved in cell wall biosynthesis